MIQSVEGARAALPLLAFAVSRLWEKRDPERKILTRAAYEEIGGVAGALAQHAEQTMERIGPERHELVREIFRNLTTAQGTRAVMDREELLSAFPDREAAEEVLAQLIDARRVASTGEDDTLRLWPMPDLGKPPLHALPHGELVAKLRSLTNIRAVRDPESSTGWTIELEPFAGWDELPTW